MFIEARITKPIKVKSNYPLFSKGKLIGWVLPVMFKEFLVRPIFNGNDCIAPRPSKEDPMYYSRQTHYIEKQGTTIAYFFPVKRGILKRKTNIQTAFNQMLEFRTQMLDLMSQNENIK